MINERKKKNMKRINVYERKEKRREVKKSLEAM